MIKVVINRTPDPIRLSDLASRLVLARRGAVVKLVRNDAKKRPVQLATGQLIDRDDPSLIATIQELGQLANGRENELQIVEIPECDDWSIFDVVGFEFISAGGKIWPPKQ